MGNFCGKKPQKNHQYQKDSMMSNMIPSINEEFLNRLVDQWQGSVIAYFKQRFKEYATKDDNSLDYNDFMKIFPQLAAFPKNVKKKAFDFFDRDKSGRIDFKEFCQSLSVCCKSDINSKIYLLFMLFDTDSDKYISRNEMQTLIKFCQPYIFKIRTSNVNNNNDKSKEQSQLGTGEQQQNNFRGNQTNQTDKLSQTQGNIAFNDGYVMQDNMKILSKAPSKEFNGVQDISSNATQNKQLKQQQNTQKEMQKKQQLLKAQQEKETMSYLFNKKQDKIAYQSFYNWAVEYFNIEEFFSMFELIPDPLLEREMIRSIIKEEGAKERQVNQLLINMRHKNQEGQKQQQITTGINDKQDNQKSKKEISSNKQIKNVGNIEDKIQQKEKFTETIYVVSWKWWFMWRYYINYEYKIKRQQNMNNNQKSEPNNNSGDKNASNAVNFNIKINDSPIQGKSKVNHNINPKTGIRSKINEVGVIGEEEYTQNINGANDVSNVANNQTQINTFFNSKEKFDSRANSPKNKLRPNHSPGRRDSNNSRNSMIDLEFNNSIPSERQEEQKVKYHLEPNAFKNNLEFNLRNYQDGSQYDPNENLTDQSPNYIKKFNQSGQFISGINQNDNYKGAYGGEEDVISDRNHFRPYSPSKVNHDANNLTQSLQNQFGMKIGKNQKQTNQNQLVQYTNENEDDTLNNPQQNSQHNQPQESQVKSVSHHHQFQQQGNFCTPRTAGMNGQLYNQDTSGIKQQNFTNLTEKQLLQRQNNNNNNDYSHNPRDINDSDLFQQPNWTNQQYENQNNYSPNKILSIQTYDASGKKSPLINPQQIQYNNIQKQNQNIGRSDPDHFQNQGGIQMNSNQSIMNTPQLLHYPDTPQSTAGLPTLSANNNMFDNVVQQKFNSAQNQGTDINHQNEIDTISQHNIYNNIKNGSTYSHQYQNAMQGQNAQNNDNLTIYNEMLHPETRQSHSQQLFTNNQQQDQQFPTTENLNNILTEQAERSEYGQNQKQIIQNIQNQQNEQNQPTVNPNIRGNLHQLNNYQKPEQNTQSSKNNENPSTLFSQSKFNMCKPLQGLSGETHDLISQDDLSKSNIAANNPKRNENNNFVQQSEFAREQLQQKSVSPFRLYDKENSKENEIQQEKQAPSPHKQIINDQQNQNANNQMILNNKNNKQIDDNCTNTNLNHQGTDKILHDDYMDEIDKGIQNTEEFDNHEEDEEHKKANDDHIRFQQHGGHNLGDRPTQIDNTDIEGEYQGELQKNILRNHDYVIIPQKAWERLFGWYGGGPAFKRKRIVDIQNNYKTVELYPPLLIGYKLKKNGDMNYDSRQELMVSSWKTLKEVMKKFQKYYKSEKTEDLLYYKKMGSQWKRAVDLEKTRLIDLQIDSGTIFLFLAKNLEEKFLEKQNQFDVLDSYEVGDSICISHPSERIKKKGYIFQINYSFKITQSSQYDDIVIQYKRSEMIQIHFKRESFRNDITFEKKQLQNYIKQENNNQSQLNIDQSLTHLNPHIKYNPKMIGLANLGNTCFINCIIQFLVHTPFFRQYLLDELYLDSIKEINNGNATNSNGNILSAQNNSPTQYIQGNQNNTNQNERSQNYISESQGQIQLIRELSQLTQLLKQKPYNDIYDPVKPSNLKKAIDISMPHFSGHEQHDAQEFLQGFLDKLNDEVKIKKVVQINKIEETNQITNSINNQNNLNLRPNCASVSQGQQMTKSFNKNTDNLSLPKEKTLSKNIGDDIFNSQQPTFPPEPISNIPLQPALFSQGQSDQVSDPNTNQKKDSNETVENQKRQITQEIQEFSIIKDVYMGQTINKIQCSACGNINYKYEDFYSISLPLPIKNEVLYEVTYVPRVYKGIIKPIKKFGIKLHRSATFGEFQQAFFKTTKISPQIIVFAEISKGNIYRNFHAMDPSIPMRNLGIRINDEIAAFEIINSNKDLEDETFSLYPHNYQNSQKITLKDLKEEEFIDFNVTGTKWVHGQIECIGQSDQKGELVIQMWVMEENFKRSSFVLKQRQDSKKLQPFRSQVPLYPKERAFFVFVVNRRKINNTMEKFGIPLCIIIPGWLTWKELHLLVFNQIKRCIDFNYLIKKYQATSKALIKQKMKSAKTQGYTQLGGDLEEIDYNNAVQTYKNDDFRSKEKSYYEQQQYVSEQNRQKAPSFHGFIEDNPSQPIYEEDEYMRNRKSLFNYQQAAPIESSKSPVRNSKHQREKEGDDQIPPKLRPTLTDYQNLYKANTSTLIQQNMNNDNNQINGPRKSHNNDAFNSKYKNPQNIVKQSVNLENLKKSYNDNHYSNEQYQQNIEEYYAAFNGEIKDSIDFLQSSFFPYKLRIIDQITQRCAICDLPLIPDNAQKESCQGCEPGLIERPLFWDVDQNNLLFSIDWKDSLSFNPSSMVPQNDESYIDLKKQKNEIKMGIPIASCFNLYTAQDKVELECDKCKVNQVQSTKHLLYKLPNVLINGLFEKIDDLVNFPLKRLDLSEWVFKENKLQQKNEHLSDASTAFTTSFNQNQSRFQKQNDQCDIYDLFAVVNHLGNGHGGHYTSFVNIKEDATDSKDCWVNFDDECVNYINQEYIISNKGYLLIYKKQFSTSAIVNLTYKKL